MDFSWGWIALCSFHKMIVVHCENGEFINPPELLTFVWGGKSITLFLKTRFLTQLLMVVFAFISQLLSLIVYMNCLVFCDLKKTFNQKHDEVILLA